ncbi:MAG: metal ABC transporter ATP-binding protein [Candidatus Tectomicrobia bacterium]|uniref:Metal ABC transporter ATP-binding protein n=1 Tax=Tectimicrobiota bacterium TaxID=2528274 RepID=A0A932ZXJ9_UNCTE|nr:metal ABC transporter ATP-binding protein [Candidatus Tectomicrobia bacterium]
MPAAEPLVEALEVSVRLGGQDILRRIDLAVRPGEVVSLIGPNGAGKTTLIRVLLGLLPPAEGSVRRRAGLVVGYLPQRVAVDAVLPLTVRRLLSLTRPVPEREAARALEEAGAAYLMDRSIHALSGGEMQRVLLARALLRNPGLLVLDEPIQNVDVTGQIEMYGIISRIREGRGCGILMVTHDLHVVMASTDRVICLNRHVCCHGRPEDVSGHPEYLALFGPQAARNLAVYTHAHDHRHGPEGEVVPLRPNGDPKEHDHHAREPHDHGHPHHGGGAR